MAAFNIWAASKTLNGFATDEIVSCLQKSIRRAMVEEACQYTISSVDRKSTRLNSSHMSESRMPSSA